MGRPLRALIVEGSQQDALVTVRELERAGCDVSFDLVDSAEDMSAALDRQTWDIVLSGYDMPRFSGTDALKLLQGKQLDIPFIIVSGAIGEQTAVALMRAGAHDYLLKHNLTRLAAAVEREVRDAGVRRERTQAREALVEKERYYRSVLQTLHEDIIVIDRQCRITDVNRTFLATTGHQREDAVGRHCYEILHGYDEPCYERGKTCLLPNVFETGVASCCRRQRRRPDGSEAWIDVLFSPLRDDDGHVTHVIEAVRDISDILAAEKSLAESEERFALAMRGANDGLWDDDLHSGQLYYSPRWKNMLGYGEDEIGTSLDEWRSRLHPDDGERALAHRDQYLAGDRSTYETEFRMRHKDGHYVDILSRAFAVRDADGKAARLVGTHVDVSERKHLEEQFRQAQKMEAIGQLAGGIAHDFNNILTGVRGSTQFVREDLEEGTQARQDLDEALALVDKASHLTRQLLAFGRRQALQPEVLQLNSVVEGSIRMWGGLIGENIEMEFAPAPDLCSVEADPRQIELVLMNLVVNARDAMPRGGRVLIETSHVTLAGSEADERDVAAGHYARISVADTGCGMDQATRQRIFEPFFTTKEKGKGTGLGLATVYGIVKQHGGGITVRSEPGAGTTFDVLLPAAAGHGDPPHEGARQAPILRGTETILVAEDEAAVMVVVERTLSSLGYNVRPVWPLPESDEDLTALAAGASLLVTDVVMPGTNGLELYDKLRSVCPALKVLYISGHAEDVVAELGPLGPDARFLEKPFDHQALAGEVREALAG